MYKKIAIVADLDRFQSDTIEAIYSVSGCISKDFTDYIHYWKHNDFWFFDTPAVIEEIAANENLDISNMTLLYYEVYEEEYNDSTNCWQPFAIEPANVILPREKRLEGFDIVSYSQSSKHECSPLSCNGMWEEFSVNRHCLFESFDEARNALACGRFRGEPGPYRIIAVYTVLRF